MRIRSKIEELDEDLNKVEEDIQRINTSLDAKPSRDELEAAVNEEMEGRIAAVASAKAEIYNNLNGVKQILSDFQTNISQNLVELRNRPSDSVKPADLEVLRQLIIEQATKLDGALDWVRICDTAIKAQRELLNKLNPKLDIKIPLPKKSLLDWFKK